MSYVDEEFVGDHYVCVSHHIQGFVCFILLIFYGGYYGIYRMAGCTKWGRSIHAKLWCLYLFSQMAFCSFSVISCELVDEQAAWLSVLKSISYLSLSNALFTLGVYLIVSIRQQRLLSTKLTVAVFAACFLAVGLILGIAAVLHNDALRFGSAMLWSAINGAVLSVAFYFAYSYTKTSSFVAVCIASFVGACLAVFPLVLGNGLIDAISRLITVTFGILFFNIGVFEIDRQIPLFNESLHSLEPQPVPRSEEEAELI